MGPQAHFANRSKCGVNRIARRARKTARTASPENGGDRAVVHQLDRQARAEDAGFDVDRERAKLRAEALVRRLRLLGPGRLGEARPVTFRRVSVASDEPS